MQTENSSPNRPLVGAIRWDAWYGELPDRAALPDPRQRPGYDPRRGDLSPDPGGEAQRSLAPEPWRYRWPFFTTLAADGSALAFNSNHPAVIEEEIDYAVQAGLDYWAFDAYPEDCPLSYTLKTYLACPGRERLPFCLFLVMGSAYGSLAEDDEFRDYVLRLLQEPSYLKVQGNRPVLYLGFLNDRIMDLLLDGWWEDFCGDVVRQGLGTPYVVVCHGNPQTAKRYCDLVHGDALSQYNVHDGKAKDAPFADLAAVAERFWANCAATGAPVAPICVAGWDRRTRVANPVSWESFHTQPDAAGYYYEPGTPAEIAAHIGRGVEWFREHPAADGTELVLVYAWNELDEGGWLVPALPPPYGEGTARLDALRDVLISLWP